MGLCVFCSSVYSVRKRTIARLAGEFYLSQSAQSSLSIFAHCFEPTEGLRHTEFTEASPPTPLRMERGVVCGVTPIGLLNRWRSCRGISVFTPLPLRRGAGGEARTCPSSSENMPFLHVEDALLGARRACSQTLSVTF